MAAATAFSTGREPAAPADRLLSLDNGLRVHLLERRGYPLFHMVAAVGAGSRDETDATCGLAHLLEHLVLFRGTEVRGGNEIAADMRRHGAYFNAHTGHDLTTFEISLPVEHADFALRSEADLLFRLRFDPAETAAEKDVILEELRQIEDDPFRLGQTLAFEALFPGHPYGRPVQGRPESLKALATGDVEAFYRRLFVPANCAVAVVADLSLDEMEAKVRAAFGALPKAEFRPVPLAPPPPLDKPVDVVRELDVTEGYLVLGIAGPDYDSDDQYAADVLTEILGQGINPLLYRPLRGGRRDFVNTVRMGYQALKRAGAFTVAMTLEPKNVDPARREATGFLKRLRNENFSVDDVLGEEKMAVFDYLAGAKNEIRFAVENAWESGLGLAGSMARHMIMHEGGGSVDYLQRIARLASPDLRTVAARYFSRSGYVSVAIVPKKKAGGKP